MNTKNTKQVIDKALTKTREGGRMRVESTAGIQLTKEELRDSTGARTVEVASMLLIQATNVQTNCKDTNEKARVALKLLGEMSPRNATEGMLAVQMIGVHNAALQFLTRGQLPNQIVGVVDCNVARASRLMRLFNEQLQAMAKLKGTAGQQKMVVEHVHVHAGGQAIVGPVGRGGGTAGDKDSAK